MSTISGLGTSVMASLLSSQSAGNTSRATTYSDTASSSNEDAIRIWRNYRNTNNVFSKSFKAVLTTLNTDTATLRKSGVTSTTDSTTAKVTYNYNGAINAAKDFADSYNKAIDYLKKKRNLAGVEDVLKNYKQTSKMKDQLERVGISVDGSGKLTVDEDAMKKALKEDQSVWGDVVTYAKSSLTTRVTSKNNYYLNHINELLTRPSVSLNA